jgi:hypothetical protein
MFCSLVSFSNPENDTIRIALVNDEPIVLKELKLCEQRNKTTGSDLSFPDEKNVENAILIKLQQQLAKKLGLVNDISYSRFETDFNAENKRRSLALQQKEVFYGPARLTEENYYNYKFSNLVIAIKNRLAEKEFILSDENMKPYYEAIKDSLFKLSDYIKVQRFDIYFNKKTETNHQTEIIRKIQSLLISKKINLVELNERFKNVAEIKSHIQIFDPMKYQNMEGEERAEVENLIGNTQTGKLSPVSRQSVGSNFYQILERNPMGYRDFESVRNSLKSRYIDYLYTKYLSALREKAIIVRY